MPCYEAIINHGVSNKTDSMEKFMEVDGFREVLADIAASCGDKAWLSLSDVARYDGSDVRTVKQRYGIDSNGINRALLARKICLMGKRR